MTPDRQRNSDLAETGVIHGRFQVLHNDHLTYILAGKQRCRLLYVGVTNPDPSLTRHDDADAGRDSPGSNPLAYFERAEMVRAALLEVGVAEREFRVVPFPVNLPELYRHYVPLEAVFYLTIYDPWGERKLEMFRELGLATEVMWQRPRERKGLKGTDVRRLMARGGEWEPLVPPAVARLARAWDLPARLRALGADDPA